MLAPPAPLPLSTQLDNLNTEANVTDTAQANPSLVALPLLKLDGEQAALLGQRLSGLRAQLPRHIASSATLGEQSFAVLETLKGAFTGTAPRANLVLQLAWSTVGNVLLSSAVGASITTACATGGIVVLGVPILRKSLKEFNKVFRQATGVEPELLAKEWGGKQLAKLGIPLGLAGAAFAAVVYYYYQVNLGYDELAIAQNLNGVQVTVKALQDFQVWLSAAILPAGSLLTEMSSRVGLNERLAKASVPERYKARTASEENLKDDLLELASFEENNLKEQLERASPLGVSQEINAKKALIQSLAARASLNYKDRAALVKVQEATVKRLELLERHAEVRLHNSLKEQEYLNGKLDDKGVEIVRKQNEIDILERPRLRVAPQSLGELEAQELQVIHQDLHNLQQQLQALEQQRDTLRGAVTTAGQRQDHARLALGIAKTNVLAPKAELEQRKRAANEAKADQTRIRNQVKGLTNHLGKYLRALEAEHDELQANVAPQLIPTSNRLEILKEKITELESISTLEDIRRAASADPEEGLKAVYATELSEINLLRGEALAKERLLLVEVARLNLLGAPPHITVEQIARRDKLRDELIPRQKILGLEYQRRYHSLKKERQDLLGEHLDRIEQAAQALQALGALPVAVPPINTQQLGGVIAGEQGALNNAIDAYQNGVGGPQDPAQQQLLGQAGVLHAAAQRLELDTHQDLAARRGALQTDLEEMIQAKIAALQTEMDNLLQAGLLGNVRTTAELNTIEQQHLSRLQIILNHLPLAQLSPATQTLLRDGVALPIPHTGLRSLQTFVQRQRSLIAHGEELAALRDEQALLVARVPANITEVQLNRLLAIQARVQAIDNELNQIQNQLPALPGPVNAAIQAQIQLATTLRQVPLLPVAHAQQLQELPLLGGLRNALGTIEGRLNQWPCAQVNPGEDIDAEIRAVNLGSIAHLPAAIGDPLAEQRTYLEGLRQNHVTLGALGVELTTLERASSARNEKQEINPRINALRAHLEQLPGGRQGLPPALRGEYDRLSAGFERLNKPPVRSQRGLKDS